MRGPHCGSGGRDGLHTKHKEEGYKARLAYLTHSQEITNNMSKVQGDVCSPPKRDFSAKHLSGTTQFIKCPQLFPKGALK